MINASDFVGHKNIVELTKKNFIPKKNSVVSLVRLACHHFESKRYFTSCKLAKKIRV